MTIEIENKIVDIYTIQQLSCQNISKQLDLSYRKVAKILYRYNVMRPVGCNYMYKDATIFLKRKRDIIVNYLQERRSTTIIGDPTWIKG